MGLWGRWVGVGDGGLGCGEEEGEWGWEEGMHGFNTGQKIEVGWKGSSEEQWRKVRRSFGITRIAGGLLPLGRVWSRHGGAADAKSLAKTACRYFRPD